MPGKPKPGIVLQVSTPTGRFAYGRVYRDGTVCFYRHITDIPRQPPVGSRDFTFCIDVDDIAVQWEQVGSDPFASDDAAWPPPTSIYDPITEQWSISDRGRIRPAEAAEAEGLIARLSVIDQSMRPTQTLQSYLAESCGLAERLVHAPDDLSAYEIGMDLFQLGSVDGPEGEVADSISGSMHWIWGDLTDAVDAPDADPDTTHATEKMRRAAHEWLAACEDPEARAKYLDHWQHDECGDRRRPPEK